MNSNESTVSINCGSIDDSFDELLLLCEEEASRLALTLELSSDPVLVSFWTKDVCELICIGKFSKDLRGTISYKLDFSQTTL